MLSTLLLSLAVVAAAEHTNVIFVLSDDQGWGDVGFNKPIQPGAGGNAYLANPPHTPELDAMANSPNSLVFSRFYSGSAVCSPTRSSALTGRTPDRECIYGAEGCGSDPAWECVENMPMPPPTFTVAEAAKALNYSTIHVGKWHLGDFFPKAEAKKKQTFAHKKWPASHPGIHGYDEWFSTEASASSSTTNCGCEPQWKNEGKGCIVGGGEYEHQALSCTNYWYPTDLSKSHQPTNPECHDATTSKLSCVANLTSKVPDDDTKEILDVFEDFLKRKTSSGEASPFLANLWLHTNHVPHPALPEWYHAYNGTDGQWAGDYLGTISQMDAQIGRLRQMLKHYGVANNTMLWFTADNGPHTQSEAPTRSSNQATGGLRQCKASLFEGGIRVPGIVEWPQGITSNMVTDVPAYTSDYLPTILDVFGMQHPQPTWHSDGVSLLPLIKNQMTTRPKPMGFRLGTQVAWIDNDMKLVYKPAQGQCLHFLPPYGKMRHADGPFLFNITADPTESHDLSKEDPKTFQEMHAAMNAWQQTIADSQKHESGCVKA